MWFIRILTPKKPAPQLRTLKVSMLSAMDQVRGIPDELISLLEARDGGWRIAIPAALRLGHDPRFALFARRFLDFVKDPQKLPDWEGPNLLAKYLVCTEAVALARR